MDSEGNTLQIVDQSAIEIANDASMDYIVAPGKESIIQKLLKRTSQRGKEANLQPGRML